MLCDLPILCVNSHSFEPRTRFDDTSRRLLINFQVCDQYIDCGHDVRIGSAHILMYTSQNKHRGRQSLKKRETSFCSSETETHRLHRVQATPIMRFPILQRPSGQGLVIVLVHCRVAESQMHDYELLTRRDLPTNHGLQSPPRCGITPFSSKSKLPFLDIRSHHRRASKDWSSLCPLLPTHRLEQYSLSLTVPIRLTTRFEASVVSSLCR